MASNDLGRRRMGRIAGLVGVVALFSMLFAALIIAGTFNAPYVWGQGLVALLGIGIFVITNIGAMGDNFSGRGTVFLATSIVSAALVAGALIGINYIAVKKPKSWDLTKDGVYTLSDATTQTLAGLKDEVRVIAFYAPTDPEYPELESRLRQYKEHTDKLKLEFLDFTRHPAEVKEFNIAQAGPRIVVKLGGKESRAKDISEESLTNSIAEVTKGATKKLYFTKGHGERGLDDKTERGIKLFADDLKSENYALEEILLAEHKEMPADVQELIIAGPQTSFNEGEAKMVHDWVEKGGKLIVLVDPTIDSGLEAQLLTWGISLDKDEVLDPNSRQPQIAIAQAYADHPITSPRSTAKLSFTLFPLARSVSKKGTVAGWTIVDLIQTGPNAWGETGPITDDAPVQYDEGQDVKGPVNLAIAATHGTGDAEARLVVVGSSGFLANGFYAMSSNKDLALNAVTWAAHDESKIAIHPKNRQSNHLFLSAEQSHTMSLFALDLMPFSLLLAGLLVWQTRKSR